MFSFSSVRLFSHSVTWVDEEMIDYILRNVLADQRAKCLEICQKFG